MNAPDIRSALRYQVEQNARYFESVASCISHGQWEAALRELTFAMAQLEAIKLRVLLEAARQIDVR